MCIYISIYRIYQVHIIYTKKINMLKIKQVAGIHKESQSAVAGVSLLFLLPTLPSPPFPGYCIPPLPIFHLSFPPLGDEPVVSPVSLS